MQSAVVDISKTDRYTMQLVRQGLILLGKYAWMFSIINYDVLVCKQQVTDQAQHYVASVLDCSFCLCPITRTMRTS